MTDRDEFRAILDGLADHADPTLRGWIDPSAPVSVARAPGRLDVMGGIADYSGSLVLQLPIREAAFAAVQKTDGGGIDVISLAAEPGAGYRRFRVDRAGLEALLSGGYDEARRFFAADESDHWAAYVVGTLLVLARECGTKLSTGLRVLVWSRVPEGKGVSSSAAVEVASMQAIGRAVGVEPEGAELARLCQVAENFVVGAPCGIMDQMTSSLGRAGHLLALLCQPAEVEGYVPVPAGVGLWGIDSGIRHAVSGSDYTSVRTGAFMGYRILADLVGLSRLADGPGGVLNFADAEWEGYLANLSPEFFVGRVAPLLPETMTGREFLARYGGTTDPVTRVDPDRTYAVRTPTKHPVFENARVWAFRRCLSGPIDDVTLERMGSLMDDSHTSYSACGLGSGGTDLLVELVRREGPESGLFGAKITGGGSGGTVAVLGRADAGDAVARVARRYAEETGRVPYVFSGSSPGACADAADD